MYITFQNRKRWFITLLLALSLLGCNSSSHTEAQIDAEKTNTTKITKEDTVSVMGDAVNYMHEYEVKYTLYDLSKTPPVAVGGAIVDPLSQGGGKGCCISLPKKWHAGMKVRLDWGIADHQGTYEQPSQDLEIPPYDVAADLYVVFHGKHEIELVVSQAEPGHPEWRGKVKQTPWDACVAENGRKLCKAALPVYNALGWDEMQGYCTYLKEERQDMSTCEIALSECMKNYEDADRCKTTLWGARKK